MSEFEDLVGDVPLLRDHVDDPDLRGLFEDDSSDVQIAVRELLGQARADDSMADRLIEALETSVEECVDDTDASAWIAVVLGEIGSVEAIPVLLRCLVDDDDEILQDAAYVAILRIGPHALRALMEWLDEEPGQSLRQQGYRLLGDSAILEDADLVEEAREFVRGMVLRERHYEPAESAFEDALQAVARLGDLESLDALRRILVQDFDGRHQGILDAIEQLEENTEGVAFVPTQKPWEERYGWLLAADENVRRAAERAGIDSGDGESGISLSLYGEEGSGAEGESTQVRVDGLDADTQLSCYYWGMGGTGEGRPEDGQDPRRLDARDHMGRPEEE